MGSIPIARKGLEAHQHWPASPRVAKIWLNHLSYSSLASWPISHASQGSLSCQLRIRNGRHTGTQAHQLALGSKWPGNLP